MSDPRGPSSGSEPGAFERLAFRRSKSVASQTLDGEAVLLDLTGGTYFTLNETGTLVWDELERVRTGQELLDALVAAFEVEVEAARRDLEALLDQLTTHGLVEPVAADEEP